jgi:hypothetical protein
MLLVSYKIFFEGKFSMKASPWLLILASALIPASMLAYFAATELRELQWMGGGVSLGSAVELLRTLDFEQIDYEKLLSAISYRLSLVEPVLYSMFAPLRGRDISDLVNFQTSLISSINRLIPGKPFGDVLFTEYAYGFFYTNEGVLFLDNYSGYEWGMYAISYQLFGYAGGLAFIFLMSALLAYFIRRAMPATSFLRGALGIFAVYTLQNWVKNFGLDNLVDRTVHRLVILVFYVMALQIIRTAAARNDAIPYQRLPGR